MQSCAARYNEYAVICESSAHGLLKCTHASCSNICIEYECSAHGLLTFIHARCLNLHILWLFY